MKLSVSKISTYEQCPHSFKLFYIDKLQPKKMPIQLRTGIEKHDLFDKVIEQGISLETLKENVRKHPKYEEYKEDCENFIKFHEMIYDGGGNIVPLHREVKIFNNEINLTGIIDRVDLDGENLLILDYKTGKDHSIVEYYFQLGTYVYLFEKKFGKKCTHWGIFFTNSGNWFIEKVKREYVDMAIQKIQKSHKMIEIAIEANHFPKTPSRLCPWCTWRQENICKGKND